MIKFSSIRLIFSLLLLMTVALVTRPAGASTAANWVGGTIDCATPNILLDAEGDGSTFCIKLCNNCADPPNALHQETVYTSTCTKILECSAREIVHVDAVSCSGTHPTRECTLTVHARNQEGTTHSGDWGTGSKVDHTLTAGAFAGKVDKVSSTDNAICRYDGTSGDIQDSVVTIDDTTGAINVNGWNTLYRPYVAAACPYTNIIVGSNAVGIVNESELDGCYNTFAGEEAGHDITTGHHNSFFGSDAGHHLTTGDWNVAMGSDSGNANLIGNGNTTVGFVSGGSITGDENTAIGHYACNNVTTGDNNICIGYDTQVPSATGNYQLNIGNAIKGNVSTKVIDFPGTIRIIETGTTPTYYAKIQGGDQSADITLTLPNTTGTLIHTETDPNALLTAGTDNVKDTHIDWGTGANQVSTDDMTQGSTNLYSTLTNIQSACTSDFHNIGGTDDDVPESGDFTNLTAGRSLTQTTGTVDADAELYTDVKCIYIENPVAADDLKSIWVSNGFASTITKIWCETDQTVSFDLQVDDGTPTGVNGSNISCTSTPINDESLAGDTTLASGDRLDLAVDSVSGTPTWVSICWTYTKDD